MMTDAISPTVVRFSISNLLASRTLDQLENDLQYLFPGTKLVAIYENHCDWEGVFGGENWNKGQAWFLDRYKAQMKVIPNPPDPRLDTDVYNVGLLMSPTMPLALPLKDFECERRQVGEVFHGPFHGLGFWWGVIERDLEHNVLLCMPAPPPVSLYDGVPRFLYRLASRVHYKAGQIEYWCPCCWKSSYSMEGVTKIPLADLAEPQICTICGRDFCSDDANAPEWAAYPYRYEWRRPHLQHQECF
jgi:hypothetical protein